MTNTLAAKIAKASKDVGGALNPDKRHLQGNYDYISADKILDRAGQALADNGVILIPAVTGMATDTFQSAKGSTYYGVTVNFAMTITDGDTSLEYPWVGMGTDYTVADKALYKAITSGHKYFLIKLLNIGAGNEDGEHEAPPPDVQAEKGARRHTTTPPAAAAGATITSAPTALPTTNGSSNGNGGADKRGVTLADLHVVGEKLYGQDWDAKRHEIVKAATGGRTDSSTGLTAKELATLVGILQKRLEAQLDAISMATAEAVPA